MPGYGQFCPVAKAAELLAERWTPLVIREILFGSRRYSELRRGLPRISPALLAKRLKQLEQAGVIRRAVEADGTSVRYFPTPAGEELRPLIDCMARWAHRWAESDLSAEELDPRFLMWAIKRNIKVPAVPLQPTVIYVELERCSRSFRRWWLVVDHGEVDLCMKDPGREPSLWIHADVETLARVFECRMSLAQARGSGRLRLAGAERMLRSMKDWFGQPAARDRDNPVRL